MQNFTVKQMSGSILGVLAVVGFFVFIIAMGVKEKDVINHDIHVIRGILANIDVGEGVDENQIFTELRKGLLENKDNLLIEWKTIIINDTDIRVYDVISPSTSRKKGCLKFNRGNFIRSLDLTKGD